MKNILFFLCLGLIFMSSSCDKDPEVDLTTQIEINFKANYDGAPFYTEKVYPYATGMDIKFSQFNFFVSNIALVKDIGDPSSETELAEIDFIDLSFNETQTTQADAGITINTKEVPAGEYTGLRIGFGVPADYNRTKPSDYGSNDILSTTSHYWSGWASYIFAKVEGIADMDGDGTFETSEGEGLVYHMGTDETYTSRIISIPANIKVLEGGGVQKFELSVDVKKLFKMTIAAYDANDDDLLDVEVVSGTHSDAELQVSKQMMNNFSEAIDWIN